MGFVGEIQLPSQIVGLKKMKEKESKDWVVELINIMERLRAPDGCPWDREQSHTTLTKYLLEESYELVDAIEKNCDHEIVDELGDVLLQVIFHCQIAKEDGRFDLQAVAKNTCEKMIRRHPHVFGEMKLNDADSVLKEWNRIKKSEKQIDLDGSILDKIPESLPELLKAEINQKKAASVGFDWVHCDDITDKIEEELEELRESLALADEEKIREELGDLLFAVINLVRFRKESSELLLRKANRKFRNRFRFIEEELRKRGMSIENTPFETMDNLWNLAKIKSTEDKNI